MSEARAANMGKIQAIIDGHAFTINNPDVIDEDIALDEAASVQSNQDLLEEQRLLQAKVKTEADIQRLEEAKRQASSRAVKEQLEAEARLIKSERLKEEDRQKEEEAAALSAQQAKEKFTTAIENAKSDAEKTVGRVVDTGKSLWGSLASVATPGSIFLPIAVLIIFYLLLLPVNGHTRIEWLWLTLTGNARLTGESEALTAASNNSQTVQGGGADFGTSISTTSFTGPGGGF